MAKMKVHEIAKELEKQSKDIIAFLQDKGIEVKAAQSSIEDDAVDMVRKAFGGADRKEAPINVSEAKTGEKSVQTEKTGKEEKTMQEAKKEETGGSGATAKPQGAPKQGNGGEPPKKKKKIIFVSNPHNSNISGSRPKGDRKPGQNSRQGGTANRPGQGRDRQEVPHKIIRPLTAPSVPESMQVDFKQNARRMENERIAAARSAKEQEARAREAREQEAKQAALAAAAAQQTAKEAVKEPVKETQPSKRRKCKERSRKR